MNEKEILEKVYENYKIDGEVKGEEKLVEKYNCNLKFAIKMAINLSKTS